jgi:Uma2 family endonuclease
VIEVAGLFVRAEEQMKYFQSGVQTVWVVYPVHRLVHIYESLSRIRVVTRVDSLDGGTLLPGFQLPLAKLFEDETTDDSTS